jgi:hypothetical protein
MGRRYGTTLRIAQLTQPFPFCFCSLRSMQFARFALTGSKDAEMDAKCGKTLRVAFGNGMRPEVWVPFQKQFGIGRVVEVRGGD